MSEKNFIECLPRKSAFKVGLASGLGIAFIIGFFILLGFLINKNDNAGESKNIGYINKDNNNNEEPADDTLFNIAESIGVNIKKLGKCVEDDKFASKVAESAKSAQAAGARGTPYSVILYKDLKVVIPGALPYDQIKIMLDAMIAGETPDTNDPSINIIPINDSDWVLGNKDGEISIIEHTDLDCPFCKRFHGTMHEVVDNYPNVGWALRHFPLTQLHPDAVNKAKTAECVGDVGGNDKFWKFVDELSK